MPLSQAALDGISDNGHQWRRTLAGFAQINKLMGGVEGDTCAPDIAAQIVSELRRIAARARKFVAQFKDYQSMSLDDTLEVFESFTPEELEAEGGIHDLRGWMNDFYDWADYHRILLR